MSATESRLISINAEFISSSQFPLLTMVSAGFIQDSAYNACYMTIVSMVNGIVGGELIPSPAGSIHCLGGMRCSSEDGEAGATAKPHHLVYYSMREASRSLLDR